MTTTVNETIPVLTELFSFNATDGDGDLLTFTLTRSDSSNAERFFYVEQIGNEGRIRVRQPLTLDRPQSIYRMILRVSDGVNTASAPVTGKRRTKLREDSPKYLTAGKLVRLVLTSRNCDYCVNLFQPRFVSRCKNVTFPIQIA